MSSSTITNPCWACKPVPAKKSHLKKPWNIRELFHVPTMADILEVVRMVRTSWAKISDKTDGAAEWYEGVSTVVVLQGNEKKKIPEICLTAADDDIPTMDAMTWNEYGGSMSRAILVALGEKRGKQRKKHDGKCGCEGCLRAIWADAYFRKSLGLRSRAEVRRERPSDEDLALMPGLDRLSGEVIVDGMDRARIQLYRWW
jgi:hypothetical protein